jgi:DNA modification methylase
MRKGFPMNQLQVLSLPIDQLIVYGKNARTHSATQINQIAASIRQFGWTNPILISPDKVIIAGHARLAAARQLRMTEVPVIVLEHLTEAQRRALVIADNQLALGAGWDEEMLRTELRALEAEDFDLVLLGFGDEELADLLANQEDSDGHTDEDALPEIQETPISVPGDLWLLGDHRVLCGDATQMDSVNKVMGGGLADMVFCDPPYNVDYQGGPERYSRKRQAIANDDLGSAFGAFLRQACMNMLAVTKGGIYICMSSSELHTLQKAFTESGGHWSTFVIWAKDRFTLGRADYQRQYEPILYGWKEGTDHFWCGARDQGDVWFVNKPQANVLHPTQKPVELAERAIRNSSKSRDTILDVFGGSGSTLIACEKAGRQARVIELEAKYVDTIVRRWEQYTEKKATLAEDGREFEKEAEERAAVAS